MKSAAHTAGALALAGLGGVFVLAVTASRGPGLLPDSAAYLSAADSLAHGQGLLAADGAALTRFPPLLPAALAVPQLLGLDPLSVARLLGALALVMGVAASARAAARAAGKAPVAGVIALLAVLCAPFTQWFAYALSEPLFIALLAVYLVVLARALVSSDIRLVVAAALIAAALALTRYVGVVGIAMGVVALLVGAGAPRVRLRRAAGFGALAAIPLALLLARNVALTGGLTGYVGQAAGAGNPLWRVLRMMVALCGEWLVDWNVIARWGVSPPVVVIAAAVLLAALPGYAVLLRSWWATATPEGRAYVGVLLLWAVAYSAFVVLAASRISAVRLDSRFVAPLFLPVLQLLIVPLAPLLAGASASNGADAPRPARRRAAAALLALLALVGALQAARSVRFTRDALRDGVGGYATTRWQELPFASWLSGYDVAPGALTNGADLLYLLTGERRRFVPLADDASGIDALAGRVAAGERVEVVWFDDLAWRTYLVDRVRLTGPVGLEVAEARPGGAVLASPPLPR